MTADIHPTAIVGDNVVLSDGVRVGPYCIVDGEIDIGPGTVLQSHVVIGGRTRIGPNCAIYPFASLGLPPQDLKYAGEPSQLTIGARCRIREHVTMHPGTKGGGQLTSVGDDCLFMVASHVAHDCRIGNGVILANNATLGGHVEIGDHAIIGGLAAIHQFVRIGRNAMVGGMSGVEHNVIPYGSAMGERARLTGLNLIGMKRHQMSRDDINAVRAAYRMLFLEDGVMSQKIDCVAAQYGDVAAIDTILSFLREDSSRSILQPKNGTDLTD